MTILFRYHLLTKKKYTIICFLKKWHFDTWGLRVYNVHRLRSFGLNTLLMCSGTLAGAKDILCVCVVFKKKIIQISLVFISRQRL